MTAPKLEPWQWPEAQNGLLFDSSLMAYEDCYELLLDGEPTGVVELPVEWVRDDAVYLMMHRFQSLRPPRRGSRGTRAFIFPGASRRAG